MTVIEGDTGSLDYGSTGTQGQGHGEQAALFARYLGYLCVRDFHKGFWQFVEVPLSL